mgnify:CR=1 FL=1
MIILGISDSHEAHACILKDGKILAAAAEERFSRVKADCGYPYTAVEACLKYAKIKKNDIDLVVFAGKKAGLFYTITKPPALFSVDDWIYQNEKFWRPKLLENKELSALDDFYLFRDRLGDSIKENPYYALVNLVEKNPKESPYEILNKIRKKTAIEQIGIEKDKVIFIRHEECHQFYGYYSQTDFKKTPLIFTIEGGGDDSSATTSLVEEGIIKEKYKTNDAMIGRLYRYITLLLGMKPCQHEYKVMGLAPYGNEYHGKKSLNHFRMFDKIKEDKIINLKKFKDVYYSSKEALEGQRFDGIAWGLQTYLEELLEEWILNNVKKYNLNDIILSGGVAQNIKAVQRIASCKGINSVWAGPIAGDGSLAIGAVWAATKRFSNDNIEGLKNIYLGTEMHPKDIDEVIIQASKKFKVLSSYSPKQVARWLSNGNIIARCEGRMEFGQRALGNRSILADPRKHDTVQRINEKIKYRDFWMPFTPSISNEDCKRFIENKNNIYSPFMTMAFDCKEDIVDKIPAVIHPADKTCRPQMLKEEDNPDYYKIIKEFENITGLPILLNTSFNLHGDSIVENPQQAIKTFEKSDIDLLLLGGKVIIRNEKNLDI